MLTEFQITRQLNKAKRLLAEKKRFFVSERKSVGDFQELRLSKPSEIWPLLEIALNEISAKDYAGRNPPEPSYEESVSGSLVWQFAWNSEHFGQRMFLRFVIKGDSYFHSSLHKSREKRK